jgi:steroid delta-isomerase-like uncharacterized protein
MSIEENKAIIQRLSKIDYSQDIGKTIQKLKKHYSPKFMAHLAEGDLDLEKYLNIASMLLHVFTDYKTTLEDSIAEGDRVVARSTISGTQKAEFMGIPATGKKIKFSAIAIYRVADGKIVEMWSLLDTIGIMQQLGIGPKSPKL